MEDQKRKFSQEIVEIAKRFPTQPYEYEYDFKDVILYNLSVGASVADYDNLRYNLLSLILDYEYVFSFFRYVYEKAPLFCPLPTIGTLPGIGFLEKLVGGEISGLDINLANLLHAEHYLKVYRFQPSIYSVLIILIELFYLRPLPFEAKLRNTYKVEDILDKGKDSILLVGVKSQDTRGRDMFYNQVLNVESTITNDVLQASLFLKGDGGWGGQRSSSSNVDIEKEPSRLPDFESEYR